MALSGLFAERQRVVCPFTHDKQRVGFFCIGLMLVKECGKDRMFIGFFCWIWSPNGAIVGLVWLILAYSFILGIGSLTWFVRK